MVDVDDYGGEPLAVGDFNGDGLDDLAVGARYGGPSDLGAAYVVNSPVFGENSLSLADATLLGAGTRTPQAMSAGDSNGDGLDDLAVTYRPVNWPDLEGKVYLVHGPLSGTQDLSVADSVVVDDALDESQSSFGITLSTHGDFDGDGLADLAVGAKWRHDGEAGVVYVLNAPFAAVEYVSNADARLDGLSGSRTGTSLSAGGDVDGDGHDDLLVGTSIESAGRAYLLHGPLVDSP